MGSRVLTASLCAGLVVSLSSCRLMNPDGSQVKITNGSPLAADSTFTRAIVSYVIPVFDPSGVKLGEGNCTGTFVNDTTMITAAHCVVAEGRVQMPATEAGVAAVAVYVDDKAKGMLIQSDATQRTIRALNAKIRELSPVCDPRAPGVAELKQRIGQEWERAEGQTSGFSLRDVAVVVFPAGTGDRITGGQGYFMVSTAPLDEKQRVKLVGFGHNEGYLVKSASACDSDLKFSGFGTKREGYNWLHDEGKGVFQFAGWASESIASRNSVLRGEAISVGPGDSGGPWIRCPQVGPCDSLEMIAVSSFGGFSFERNTSNGPDLRTPVIKDVFQKAIQCGDPSGTRCAKAFVGSSMNEAVVPSGLSAQVEMTFMTALREQGPPPKINVLIAVLSQRPVVINVCPGTRPEACTPANTWPVVAQGPSSVDPSKELYAVAPDTGIALKAGSDHMVAVALRDPSGKVLIGEVHKLAP